MNPMDDLDARSEAASNFVHYASKIDKDTYAHLMRLVVKVQNRALSPNSFRAKIKYLLRDRWDRIPNLLNPLLPDEYQLSQEELLQEPEDYKHLEIIEKYVTFMNEMKHVVKTSEALSVFLELIESHQRKEIDAKELYEKVYNQLEGNFGLMKQLSDILGEKLTPSYISVPEQLWETSMSEDGVLNNNRLRINNTRGAVGEIQKVNPNYLYDVDALIKKYLGSTPTKAASNWIDDGRYELDLLRNRLELAVEKVQRVIMKIDSGALNEETALSKHLSGHSLKVVKRMFPRLEALMSEPRETFKSVLEEPKKRRVQVVETFKSVLEELRKRRAQVVVAIVEFNRNIHKSRIQRHV